MVNRHNHTYKIRNCANNKEVKSLVSAHRLKPYYDPLTRPTNPSPAHANDNTQLDHDKVDLPGDQPADPRGRMQVPALPPRPTIPRQENNRKQQRQQPRQKKGNNNNQNRPENPPIVETRPSCQDCNRGTCTPFSEKMIDRLLASSRGNGTLYYKVKLTTGNSEWHFLCKIPSALVRKFHSDRTMSGKKRKRPLHHTKHKFFDKRNQQPKENVSSDDSQSNSVNVLNSTGESTTTSSKNEEELLAIPSLAVEHTSSFRMVPQFQNGNQYHQLLHMHQSSFRTCQQNLMPCNYNKRSTPFADNI
mgnify:CR=1 FL=1